MSENQDDDFDGSESEYFVLHRPTDARSDLWNHRGCATVGNHSFDGGGDSIANDCD